MASTGKDKDALTALITAKQPKAQNTKPNTSAQNNPKAEASQKQATPAKPSTAKSQPTKSKASLIAVLIIVVLGIGGYFGYDAYQQSQEELRQQTIAARNEQSAWQQAQQLNTIDGYNLYLKNWPKGEHSAQAKRLQGELEDKLRQAELAIDNAAWQEARQSNTSQAYQAYLDAMPDGQYIQQAKEEKNNVFSQERQTADLTKAKEQDEQAWQQAIKSNSIASYKTYLNSQTKGQYQQQAQSAIDKIELENSKVALTITTEPSDATIQILNIKSKYQDGIKLPSGKYQLLISKKGYISQSPAINLSSQESKYRFNLELNMPKAIISLLNDMVSIPAGSFVMGCSSGDDLCEKDEKPLRTVSISPFKMMATEVTWSMWDACAEAGACSSKSSTADWGRGEQPLINSDYHDVVEYFIPWLNKTTGQHFRLPSEAEWEYAARAGTLSRFYWGNKIGCSDAYFVSRSEGGCSNSSDGPSEVKSYPPNAFGLYDMLGNVWELTADCRHAHYKKAPLDGSVWIEGDCGYRVKRGGAFDEYPTSLRSSHRKKHSVGSRTQNLGFRLAMDIPSLSIKSIIHSGGTLHPVLNQYELGVAITEHGDLGVKVITKGDKADKTDLGLKPNDVIMRINKHRTKSIEQLAHALKNVTGTFEIVADRPGTLGLIYFKGN